MSAVIKRAPKPATADPVSDQVATKAAATAPDSKAKKSVRGRREMFSMGLEPDLMAELDAARAKLGLSRPAFLKICFRHYQDAAAKAAPKDH